MLSKYKAMVLVCGMLCVHNLQADESIGVNEHTVIDLHEAVTRSLDHNPELASFGYRLKAEQARAEQAGLGASPEVSLNIEDAAGSGVYKGLDNSQATLGIAWLLEGDIRDGYSNVANAQTQLLTTEADIRRLDVASQTAKLFVTSLALQARSELVDKSLSLAKQAVDALARRSRAGGTAQAELARAQAEVARWQLEREDVEHELQSSYRLLAAQWGESQPGFEKLDGELFSQPALIPYENLQTRLEMNPAFMRLFSERSIRQAELELAEAQASPAWKFNLGVRHHESTRDQSLVAGVSIPFGERSRNRAGITEAQARLSAVMQQEVALRIRYQATLFVQYQEYKHSLHRIESYRDEIIPRLEEALRQTRRAFQLGRYSYLEWQSVQNELLSAQFALLEASVDAHLKRIEIERLTGVQLAQANKNS